MRHVRHLRAAGEAVDENVADTIDQLSGLSLSDWLWAGGIIIGALVVAAAIRRVVARVLAGATSAFAARLLGRLASAFVFAIGLVYALGQVGVSVGPLLGLLGVAGLALAFAFQDILENFIAGVLMIARRPLRVGDQVETADYEGTVEDINLRAVALRTYDGVRVYIPNATVWKAPIVNNTELGARRTTLEVGVAYDTDLDVAREVIADAMSGVAGVEEHPPPEAYVQAFGASSIDLAARFWHQPEISVEWTVRDEVARSIKRALDAAGIEIPFPQRVVHHVGRIGPDDP